MDQLFATPRSPLLPLRCIVFSIVCFADKICTGSRGASRAPRPSGGAKASPPMVPLGMMDPPVDSALHSVVVGEDDGPARGPRAAPGGGGGGMKKNTKTHLRTTVLHTLYLLPTYYLRASVFYAHYPLAYLGVLYSLLPRTGAVPCLWRPELEL